MKPRPPAAPSATSSGLPEKDAREIIAALEQKLAGCEREIESHQTSGRFLNSLLEHLPVIVYRRDTEGRLTFANQRYCERRGQPLAALLGKTDFDLSPRPLAEK